MVTSGLDFFWDALLSFSVSASLHFQTPFSKACTALQWRGWEREWDNETE